MKYFYIITEEITTNKEKKFGVFDEIFSSQNAAVDFFLARIAKKAKEQTSSKYCNISIYDFLPITVYSIGAKNTGAVIDILKSEYAGMKDPAVVVFKLAFGSDGTNESVYYVQKVHLEENK